VLGPQAAAAKKNPGTNPLANVPVTGTLTGATINITDFVVQDGALAVVFDLVNSAGTVLGTFTEPVAAISGTCDILHLELGPLDLDLLGLVVHLDKVVLDIDANAGGGILGDLLCGIAGLLDNPTGLAELLDRILRLVGGLFSGLDVVGTVTGATLNITKFVVDNGALAAQGTITNSAGQVLDTFTAAIDATGTCQILHLELGPLDLDLLGLEIHLDRVVLDITAQSGPGNLLGNLLCGIAGLLDSGGPLTTIVNLLNQLLGLFR